MRMATELSSHSELSAGSNLPPELLSHLFTFLPFRDLKKALLVCRSSDASQVPQLPLMSVGFPLPSNSSTWAGEPDYSNENTSYIWPVIEIAWKILPLQALERGGRAAESLGKTQAGLLCPRGPGAGAAWNPPAEQAAVP